MRGPRPWRTNRARVLRSEATPAETKLWQALRGRRLDGFELVRQAPVGPCFADFPCRECGVVVEIDGATHGTDDEIANDAERTSVLQALGYPCSA